MNDDRLTSWLTLALTLLVVAAAGEPALAQRSRPGQGDQQEQQEEPKPETRAQKARQLFRDATALAQTGRGDEAADLFESIAKTYPTNEYVPEALARAVSLYYTRDRRKAEEIMDLMKRNLPNNEHTVTCYWRPVEVACSRDSKTPLDERIRLLEIYLDRYWAQANFAEAIEKLADTLQKAEMIKELDALLAHALSEVSPESTGHMINMIQRACGNRSDHENMVDIYDEAAKNMDADEYPAAMAVRMLQINYMHRAGVLTDEEKKDESLVGRAQKQLDRTLREIEQVIRERPRSEHAAWLALEKKPAVLRDMGKPDEGAKALRVALTEYGIFALPKHWDFLADLEIAAGNHDAAVEVLDRRIAEPNWPYYLHDLMQKKRGVLWNAGKHDEAMAVNETIIEKFPDSRASLVATFNTVGLLLAAERHEDAAAKLAEIMSGAAPQPTVVETAWAYVNRFAEEARPPLLMKFVETYPAAGQADEARKVLEMPVEDSPTAQAQALFEEYRSFAKEGNVDAARRRIDRLFEEFPTSNHGVAAAVELGAALKKAGKVEMHAELYMQAIAHDPLDHHAENRLRDAASAYVGASLPDKAMEAYRALVDRYRYSNDWHNFVRAAANTLDAQNKLSEARDVIERAADSIGQGTQAVSIRAWNAQRHERQDEWTAAADTMLDLLGSNASNPLYRPLIADAMRFLVVAGSGDPVYKQKEAQLLLDLVVKYEGWDEADRIRLTLSGTYARMGKPNEAIREIETVKNNKRKYQIGAHGEGFVRHLSKYSRGLWEGTIGYHPVDRVEADMSGGYGNYLYAHTAEDMIDYVLMINKPEGYLERLKQELGRMIKTKPNRPRGYKSGIPYRTKNVPRPTVHPLPEQRRIYGMVSRIEHAHRSANQRFDPALWLQVYPLWPDHYKNGERVRAAASALLGRGENANNALAILKRNYNPMVWEPSIMYAQGRYAQGHGSSSTAAGAYKALIRKYRDNSLADRAASHLQDMGAR